MTINPNSVDTTFVVRHSEKLKNFNDGNAGEDTFVRLAEEIANFDVV